MNTLCLLAVATLLTAADDRPLQLKSEVQLLTDNRPSFAVPVIGFTAGALLGTAGIAATVVGLISATSGGNFASLGILLGAMFMTPGIGAILISAAMFIKAAFLLREYNVASERIEALSPPPVPPPNRQPDPQKEGQPLFGLTPLATF